MTLKQKVLDYLRAHKEPFTLEMLRAEVGGLPHTLNAYVSQFLQDGIVAYAAPKTKSNHFWKPREYKPT